MSSNPSAITTQPTEFQWVILFLDITARCFKNHLHKICIKFLYTLIFKFNRDRRTISIEMLFYVSKNCKKRDIVKYFIRNKITSSILKILRPSKKR